MASDILVDSNVYLDLLRAGRDPARVLGDWAGARDLAICGMIRLEVLRGIKSLKLRRALSGFMDVLVNVPSDARLWNDAGDLAWSLDRRGRTLPGSDLVIAASALRLGAAVLTSDAHFEGIDGLPVIAPLPEWFA